MLNVYGLKPTKLPMSRDSFQFIDDVQVDRATTLSHVAGAFSFTRAFRLDTSGFQSGSRHVPLIRLMDGLTSNSKDIVGKKNPSHHAQSLEHELSVLPDRARIGVYIANYLTASITSINSQMCIKHRYL